MKRLTQLIILFGLICCGQNEPKFSETELSLFDKIGFDKNILSELKEKIDSEFTQFEISDPGYSIDENGNKQKSGIEKLNGISFKVSESKAYDHIFSHKDKLNENGYLIFISESEYESPSTVTVIKSTDKFDILRIQKTDGINLDIENKDIIEKLQKWDALYDIEIIGADFEWVEIIFKNEIDNVALFAQEVYSFCPDSVDQGVGEISELERIIKEDKRLFLWWD